MKYLGFALYVEGSDTVSCSETGISVPRKFPRRLFGTAQWVCIGDINDLDAACPGHKHDNAYAINYRLNDAEWTDADEQGATTVYQTR